MPDRRAPSALEALQAAQRLTAGLAATAQERDLLAQAARTFAEMFEGDYAAILISREDGGGVFNAEYPATPKLEGMTVPPDAALVADYASRGMLASVSAIEGSPLLPADVRGALQRAGLRSAMLFPMGSTDDRWMGMVVLAFKRDLALPVEAVDSLSVLALQVGGLVQGMRQVARTQRQARQLNSLLTLSQAMGRTETEEELGYEIAKQITDVLPVSQFVMLRGSPTAESLALIGRWEGGKAQRVRADQPITVPVTQTLVSRIQGLSMMVDVSDFGAHSPAWQGLFGLPSRSGLAAPLIVGDEQIGALVVESDRPYTYTDAERMVFNQLVAQTNTALTRLRATFGLQRTVEGAAIVNSVTQRIQGETTSVGIITNGTLATLQVLNARRVTTKLGNPLDASTNSGDGQPAQPGNGKR
ncbi:MAG: hypothetical protein MUF38_09025 [Anaerolineae bacterium]|nr:hypothetical protein [Anaerolineae bacterium]